MWHTSACVLSPGQYMGQSRWEEGQAVQTLKQPDSVLVSGKSQTGVCTATAILMKDTCSDKVF